MEGDARVVFCALRESAQHVALSAAAESGGGDKGCLPMSVQPSKKSESSVTESDRTGSSGRSQTQAKRPCSSRLCKRQRPVPSKYSTFARRRSRPTNKTSQERAGF